MGLELFRSGVQGPPQRKALAGEASASLDVTVDGHWVTPGRQVGHILAREGYQAMLNTKSESR